MPRLKTDVERGPVGVWLRRERKARGWEPEDVVKRLTDSGFPIRVDYYRGIEAGRPFSDELLDALKRLHGSEPESNVETVSPADFGAAIAALVLEVRGVREALEAIAEAQVERLGRADRRAILAGTPSANGRSGDDETTRP